MNILSLEQQIFQSEFATAINREASQTLDLHNEIFVEIVLLDGSRADEVTAAVQNILQSSCNGRPYTLIVRRKWEISQIGDPMPAYGPSGGLRAACLVPVTLVAGSESVIVTVSITKLAEIEFERILGPRPDLMKRVAEAVIQSSLQRGGRSYWNPQEENYLEMASSGVANVSRLLKQAA